MANSTYQKRGLKNNNGKQNQIKCIQINLKHTRIATDSFTKQIEINGIDVAFIQELFTMNNKVAGIPRKFRIFNCGKERSRAAIVNR